MCMNVFASGALSDAGELGFCICASMGGIYPDYAPYRLVLLDAYSSPLRPGVFVELRDMLLAWGQRCHARGIPGLYAGEVLAEASVLSGLAANALPLPPARVDLSLAAAPHIVAGHVRVIRELIDKGASRPLGAVLDGAGDPDDPLKVAAALGVVCACGALPAAMTRRRA
jgi:hypothetical protein